MAFSPTTNIEKMIEGELDAHLGYDKHSKSVKTNIVMVFIQKVKTTFRESEI
jgi:hypothetical protein